MITLLRPAAIKLFLPAKNKTIMNLKNDPNLYLRFPCLMGGKMLIVVSFKSLGGGIWSIHSLRIAGTSLYVKNEMFFS